jgi:hypothetical protein
MERAGEGGAVKRYSCICGTDPVLEHLTITNVGSLEVKRDEYRVMCPNCGMSTDWKVQRVAAIAAWEKEIDWWLQ